jgi:hypothetical protein
MDILWEEIAIRLAAAAWCLACFVLVQAYSSTLISSNVPALKITVNRTMAQI